MALGLGEHGSLKERFVGTAFSNENDFDLSGYISARHNLIDLTAEGDKRGIQIQMGMGDIEQLGAALRGANGTTAALINQKKIEEKEKKDRQARRLQAYLDDLRDEIDALGKEIDALDKRIDNVEDIMQQLQDGSIDAEAAMKDPEVQDAIAAWEKRTGKKFDPEADNATDILTAILGTHRDGLILERNRLQDRANDLIKQHNDAAIPSERLQPGQQKEAKYIASKSLTASAEVAVSGEHLPNAEAGEDTYDSFQDDIFNFEPTTLGASDNLSPTNIDSLELDLDTEIALSDASATGGLDNVDGIAVAQFNASAEIKIEIDDNELEIALSHKTNLGPMAT